MKAWIAAGVALAAVAAGLAGQAAASQTAREATQRVLVGRSVQKRAITAAQIGDPSGARVALVVGVIHGDERAGLRIVDAHQAQGGRGAGGAAGNATLGDPDG